VERGAWSVERGDSVPPRYRSHRALWVLEIGDGELRIVDPLNR
jgi:hypothetical protein